MRKKLIFGVILGVILSGGLGMAEDKGSPFKEEELRKSFSPEQYRVTRENGTELPFANEYWNNKRAGIYVDIITGEPLFSSAEKFDSGTGWPSFTAPINKEEIIEKEDRSLGRSRTEV